MKSLIVLLTVLFAACNQDARTDSIGSNPVSPAVDSAITYAYTPSYSSSFEIGNPNHSKIVLEVWKAFDENKLDGIRSHLADSLVMRFGDGTEINTSADSVIVLTKEYRNSVDTIASHPAAFISLRSTDKNEDWVAVWATEFVVTNGVRDSSRLHELWHFNQDRKIDAMYQYRQPFMKK